jgi:hypothetical protein
MVFPSKIFTFERGIARRRSYSLSRTEHNPERCDQISEYYINKLTGMLSDLKLNTLICSLYIIDTFVELALRLYYHEPCFSSTSIRFALSNLNPYTLSLTILCICLTLYPPNRVVLPGPNGLPIQPRWRLVLTPE